MTPSGFDENLALEHGAYTLIGIDEAGRGPIAGPVVACACVVPAGARHFLSEVRDSKKLSPAKRRKLFSLMQEHGVIYGLGFSSRAEIDSINILQATFLAMRRAVAKLPPCKKPLVLVDGPYTVPGIAMPQKAVVDGDDKSLCIGAASIAAKVVRDECMERFDKKYPAYGFAKHKGYGTRAHMQALETSGPCPLHRKTFLPEKTLFDEKYQSCRN